MDGPEAAVDVSEVAAVMAAAAEQLVRLEDESKDLQATGGKNDDDGLVAAVVAAAAVVPQLLFAADAGVKLEEPPSEEKPPDEATKVDFVVAAFRQFFESVLEGLLIPKDGIEEDT